MRRKLLLLLLLLGAYKMATAYENTYAVIIGVADYKNFASDDGDLNYTINDAVSFAAFLKSKKGGSIPAANIVLLTDAQASKANIQSLVCEGEKGRPRHFLFFWPRQQGLFLALRCERYWE